jgi:bacteriorhodopsin
MSLTVVSPLLLLDILLICGIDIGENIVPCILACALIFVMLIAGWKASKATTRRGGWLMVGFGCLFAVYCIVLGLLEHTKKGSLQTVTIFLLFGVDNVRRCRHA